MAAFRKLANTHTHLVLQVRHVVLERIEAAVDDLDPVPLPGVPPRHRGGLGLLDGVVVLDDHPAAAHRPEGCPSLLLERDRQAWRERVY